MAFSIPVYRAQVDGLFSADNDELSQYRRDLNIKAAVEQYGIDVPYEPVEDVTGDGGRYYPLTGGSASLSAFVDGFSRVLSIEYPALAVSSDHDPQMIDPSKWNDDYWDATTRYLYLVGHQPSASETMRIRFTAPYLWSVATATTQITQIEHGFSVSDWIYNDGTVWKAADAEEVATAQVSASADADTFTYKWLQNSAPVEHFHAICYLAASMNCQAISAKYSRTSDDTIGADSVDHGGRATAFAERATEFRAQYEKAIEQGEAYDNSGDPAAQFIDVTTTAEWPTKRRYLFHRR